MKDLFNQFGFKQNKKEIKRAVSATILIGCLSYGIFVMAQAVTLSVTVAQVLTFTTSSSGFATSTGTITPGTPLYATTTLQVTTNDNNGWNITLSGTNAGGATTYNLQSGSNSIQDQTQWVPGGATTTAGNATTTTHFVNSGNVLAFRVMSASSTNGTPFLATAWWGTDDTTANALWAGIASTSVLRKIGDAGGGSAGSYSASTHYNTVQYYLSVANTQPTGTYTAPITYTATGD